jgi:hypothetical protein
MKAFNLIALIFILTSCSSSEEKIIQTEITRIADHLSSFDSTEVRKISTPQGYKSLQRWSSNFEDSSAFLLSISERLHARDYKIEMEDSTLYKIVFENHKQPMLGPDGALMIKVDSNERFLIDEYRGGK